MSYKRAKRSILNKPSKWVNYWDKLAQILNAIKWNKAGIVDLSYFDESGFSLDSNIPYTWSPINEPTKVPSNRFAKRINVLGFLNTNNNNLFYKTTTGKVDSNVVIDLFDEFANELEKPTIVILDNASIHKSKLFKENIERWEKMNLHLLYLPTYSPELNLIEILWKSMKYQWYKLEAFTSFKALEKHIESILSGFGDKYDINFT